MGCFIPGNMKIYGWLLPGCPVLPGPARLAGNILTMGLLGLNSMLFILIGLRAFASGTGDNF